MGAGYASKWTTNQPTSRGKDSVASGLDACWAAGDDIGSQQEISPGAAVSLVCGAQGDASAAPPPQRGAAPSAPSNAHDDPISGNGEFVLTATDLHYPGFALPLEFRRTYRSRIDYDGPLGYGWDHNYNQRLFFDCAGVDYQTGANGKLRFTVAQQYPTAVYYAPPPEVHLTLTQYLDPSLIHERDTTGRLLQWVMQDEAGIKYYFNGEGLLKLIVHPSNDRVTLDWRYSTLFGHRLHIVTGSGRTLTYDYYPNELLKSVGYQGNVANFKYSADGDLWRVLDARGDGPKYFYDSGHGPDNSYIPDAQLTASCRAACGPPPATCPGADPCTPDLAALAVSTCADFCNDTSRCIASCPGSCQAGCPPEANGLCTKCTDDCITNTRCTDRYCSDGNFTSSVDSACGNVCDLAAQNACGDACSNLVWSFSTDDLFTMLRVMGNITRGIILAHVDLATVIFEALKCSWSWIAGVGCDLDWNRQVANLMCGNFCAECYRYGGRICAIGSASFGDCRLDCDDATNRVCRNHAPQRCKDDCFDT
jgi:hypothetical protein